MKHNPQSGNVLFYILIAVALLGALSFAVSESSRGAGDISEDRAKLYANEIVEYGNVLATAVGQLRLRGCSDTEISFENNLVSDYDNTNAPTDESCHVFSPNGGAVTYMAPNAEAFDTSKSSYTGYGNMNFTGDIQVMQIGNDCGDASCSELMVTTPYLKQEVCNQINKLSNAGTEPFIDEQIVGHSYSGSRRFDGDYTFSNIGNTSTIGDQDPEFIGKNTGCIYRGIWVSGGQPYEFYRVLIAR